MYLRLLRNDIRKNPVSNLVTFLFTVLAAGIAASVFLMMVLTFTSISSMYEKAQPPHFLQMHKGEMDQAAIDQFNQNYAGVLDWQTVKMVDIFGENIAIEGDDTFTLADCRLDIGFVKQNLNKDLLLDENRNKIELKQGEIGIPIILMDQYPVSIGDKVRISCGNEAREFTVAAFVHDAQMNSTLCSSTRFLLSEEDFDTLPADSGEVEYIIETYFDNKSEADTYRSAYEQAELPQNGQAVTYQMIFLLSAMTDIMTAMVFLLISILLLAVSLLCMKYTMAASMEEELTEIGTMKAIGIPETAIGSLYLVKMRILIFAGAVFGFFVALLCMGLVTSHMKQTFGEQPINFFSLFLAFAASGLIYLISIQYCKHILKRLKKVSVVDALVTEKGWERTRKTGNHMHQVKKIGVNFLVALNEVKNGYSIVFFILFLVAFLVLVPINLVSTMSLPDFITYMGSDVRDIMIEIEQGEDLEGRYQKAIEELNQINHIRYDRLRRVKVTTTDVEENEFTIHIDTGKTAGSGLKYLTGTNPQKEHEIALSKLLATQLGKSVNDTVTVSYADKQKELVVSGIYQDVTSGGMTAKSIMNDTETEAEQYAILVDTTDDIDNTALTQSLRDTLGGGYTVELMSDFIEQTLGGVITQVSIAKRAAVVIGIVLTFCIVVLFIQLRFAREVSQIAIKKAVGIPLIDIWKQELYPVLIAAGAGILGGAILANGVGDEFVSLLFSSLGMGIERVQFILHPIISWILVPVLLILLVGMICVMMLGKIRKMDTAAFLNEE